MKQTVQKEIVSISVIADIQDNGDGTWTATINLPGISMIPRTAETKEKALSAIARASSKMFSDSWQATKPLQDLIRETTVNDKPQH